VPTWSAEQAAPILARLRAGDYAWVVLPSRNAARLLVEGLRAAGATDADLASPIVLCGPGTAQVVRDLGLPDATVLERFSATAALAHLTDDSPPAPSGAGRVLVPRAAEGRDELLDGLRRLGADVLAPVAYRTVAVPDAANRLRAGGIDVVTVCSPSAVRSIAATLSGDIPLVCLGETTAAAARDLGLRVDAVAARTSMESLVEAVQTAVGLPLPLGEGRGEGAGRAEART
jgi:uroporphyrinogen-III synthase